MAHMIANIAKKGVEASGNCAELVAQTIADCKLLVRYFAKGELNGRLPTTLKQDCPTRWLSTLAMLKSVDGT